MKEIHDRMPVILSRDDERAWLNPDLRERSELQPLLKPCPSSWLDAAEVSPLVNSVKNNSEELLRPVTSSRDSRPSRLFD